MRLTERTVCAGDGAGAGVVGGRKLFGEGESLDRVLRVSAEACFCALCNHLPYFELKRAGVRPP